MAKRALRPRKRQHRVPFPRPLRRLLQILLVGLVINYLVLPQIAGINHSLHLLATVNLPLVGAGIGLEILSWISYAQLSRAVLAQRHPPSLWAVQRIQMATLSVSHVVPGGTAAGGPLGYRLLTRTGLSGGDAAFALATQGAGSAVVLNMLLWLSLLISIPLHGFNPLYVSAAIAGALLIGAFSTIVISLIRGKDRAAHITKAIARRLPFFDEDRVEAFVRGLAERLQGLAGDPRVVRRAIGWAAANWLLDAASLWIFIGAFGHWVSPDSLLVAYGLANVLAAIPLTPGGLGVVEGVLITTLVGFGTPRGIAVLGVIGYRLFNFWLPIPLGGLTYLSFVMEYEGNASTPWRRQLRRAAEEAVGSAEGAGDWARGHGLRVPARPRSHTTSPPAGAPPLPPPSLAPKAWQSPAPAARSGEERPGGGARSSHATRNGTKRKDKDPLTRER